MSSSVQQDDSLWSDFDNLRHSVKSHTVDRLKQIITGLNEENGITLSKSGKKQELIDRITTELERYRYSRNADLWTHARNVLHQVRTSGMYAGSGASQAFTSKPTFSMNNTHVPPYPSPRAPSSNVQLLNSVGTSSIGRYDPYAPPRRPFPAPVTSVKSNISTPPAIRFKSSPFFRVDQPVSTVVECPESTGSMDRRSQTLTFALTQDQITKLSSSGSRYQLRLYCTTNTFYTPSPSGFRSNTSLCPIEFPATCEVRVNNMPLQANLKGIKKKPGTAPPADLSKVVRMAVGQQNRIEMIYVNSQANTSPKKFYLVVFLVEASSVEQLVDRLRKGKFKTSEEIRAQMAKSAFADDDIVIGKQKMTLKCPLSYTRISIPCRSSKCVHPQCFDAISWYSVMEQTSTWLCPVCEKSLNPEELIVDGYFGNILEQTPESVEEVEVEPDGEWHTTDNKIGSKTWMEAHRSKRTEGGLTSIALGTRSNGKSRTPSPLKTISPDSTSLLQSPGEVVVLDSDSDNEDETQVKRELSPADPPSISTDSTRNGSSVAPTKPVSSTVIDLTLDSDDEGDPPAAPMSTSKRKASGVIDRSEDVSFKKSRVSDVSIPSPSGGNVANGYLHRGSSASSGPDVLNRSPYQRISIPLPRQASSSSGRHPNSPPSASTSPAIYYTSHPAPMQAQNSHPFIHYTGPFQTPMNGSGVPHNGGTAGVAPHSNYNPYLTRSGDSGGSGWP